MASALKNLSVYDESKVPSAKDLKIGIVVAEWNHHITFPLYDGVLETLLKHEAKEENIEVVQVPGAYELPSAAKILLANKKLDAVICLGCVIKGETDHDVYINQSVANALQQLGIISGTPCIFGLLTPNTEEQAIDRAGGKHGNKGVEAAITALRMAQLKNQFKKGVGAGIGF